MIPIFWVFLLAFLESLLISVLIKIWLYLTDVILDGTYTSMIIYKLLVHVTEIFPRAIDFGTDGINFNKGF